MVDVMASLATIFRQVEREGAPWGLVPEMREGKVCVCEKLPEIHRRGAGLLTVPTEQLRVICSLDENSPMDAFAGVLRHRLKREHHDFMKMVASRQARVKAELQKEADLRRKDLRAKLESKLIRQRIMFHG